MPGVHLLVTSNGDLAAEGLTNGRSSAGRIVGAASIAWTYSSRDRSVLQRGALDIFLHTRSPAFGLSRPPANLEPPVRAIAFVFLLYATEVR
jgi:hypothetical protein